VRELSLHILDILENALEAGANRIEVEIIEDTAQDRLTINVSDNGRGMDEKTLARVADPFFTTRTTRHVGLGIPLFKAAAQRCNGDVVITSQRGVGTRVVADFQRSHIDRAPLGDMQGTLLSVMLARKQCDIHFRHQLDERVFEFDTAELGKILGDVPLDHPKVRSWLQGFLAEGYAELQGRPSA
jgi:anti-sigma regulatory factor (Ser/Thr protein kinase)